MRLIIKILKIFTLIIVSAIIILSSISILLQDKVGDIFLKALNNNISTRLDIGSFRLSLIKKFPKASFELKNIFVHSSSRFDSCGYNGINTDTLLNAKFVSIEFSMTDLIKGNYSIESIGIKSGYLNLFRDSTGLVNYHIYWKEQKNNGGQIILNLERIYLSDVRSVYNDMVSRLKIEGIISNGRLRSRISKNDIDFDATAGLQINLFQLNNTRINTGITTDIDLNLHKSDSGVQFNKGKIRVEDWDFLLTGFVSTDNILDLDVSGKNIDISKITNYFPEKYHKIASEYKPEGKLKVDGKIKGPAAGTLNPHIEVSFSLNNAHIEYGKSDLSLYNLSFDGFYTNGSKNRPETSSVSISNFTGKLGSAEYNGSFKLSHFNKPVADISLKGIVYPAELKEFFNFKNIEHTGGSVNLDLRLSGNLKKGKYTLNDLTDLSSESVFAFNSFDIEFRNRKFAVKDVNGSVLFSQTTIVKDLQFVFKEQEINFDGEFSNLPGWLAGKPVILEASGNISFTTFRPDHFFLSNPDTSAIAPQRAPLNLPEDITADLNFSIDTFIYKSFTGMNIKGILNYKPRLLNFKSITINSQGGTISGNGLLAQNPDKSVIGRGSFIMNEIDVNEAFTTFNNFGQGFLKAENIAGMLSGSLSLLLPLDSMLKPEIKSITAEGKYILQNGALVNFEPVKQLSSYIELSELENISFKQLENDFLIRSNYLYIPQMDVKSSAADLSINGKHGFDNQYEYHVRVLLSEILSKKARNNRTDRSEFGDIEDDGLGRTTLPLKIVGKEDNMKVSYDAKAASAQIIDDIRNEKQILKTILNQEYGLFESDTTVKDKPERKPRFRITWEGSDTLKTDSDTLPEKKDNILKNLFKKK